MSLVFGLIAAILLVLWGIGVKVAELSRTLKRIEARLTLSNHLDEETALMDRGLGTLRYGLRNRAMHPDTWISKAIEEEHDLRGREWKEARSQRRYAERRYRD